MASVDQDQFERLATGRADEMLVEEGELAHADEVIPAPDAPSVYPKELLMLFAADDWADDLAAVRAAGGE